MKKVMLIISFIFIGMFIEMFNLTTHAETRHQPITMAYYRIWRDITMPKNANSDLPYENVISMTDLPSGLDIVSLFHYVKPGTNQEKFWQTVHDVYVPTLHKRGTKVIKTLGIEEIYDVPSKQQTPTQKEYDDYAQKLIETHLIPYNLDGLDIDMEAHLTSSQEEKAIHVIYSLNRKLKQETSHPKLLIYDTNQDNHYLFKEIASQIDYLFLQAYGRDTKSLDQTWQTYRNTISATKFVPGITFPEEQDQNRWYDAYEPFKTSNAYLYAKWQPIDGPKGGMFIYAIDRDGKKYGDDTITKTDFSWTNRIIDTIKEDSNKTR